MNMKGGVKQNKSRHRRRNFERMELRPARATGENTRKLNSKAHVFHINPSY